MNSIYREAVEREFSVQNPDGAFGHGWRRCAEEKHRASHIARCDDAGVERFQDALGHTRTHIDERHPGHHADRLRRS